MEDLHLHYSTLRGVVRAVDGVSFEVDEGAALGIVGESGCGKTSLGIAVMRLLPSNVQRFDGGIYLDGQDLQRLSKEEFRRTIRWKKIAMVFQGAMNSLNPVMRVGDQVAEPLLVASDIGRKGAMARVSDLLEMVGLPREAAQRYPHELSGGMKQRILIAMALILNPRLLIMDEPTSALDVSVQAQIMNLIKRLKVQLNLSVIFITHDIALASDICDTVCVMYAGELAEIGTAETILKEPRHPYAQLLLSSIPRLRGRAKPAYIPGDTPDLVTPPPGCRFHPRCPYVFEPCRIRSPAPFPLGGAHLARCWLLQDSKHGPDQA